MTELLTRPTVPDAVDARPAGHRRLRPLPVAGPFRAMACAASSLLVVEALVLLCWATGGRTTAGAGAAARVGADLWLLGHGTSLRLPADSAGLGAGQVDLVPLGLTVLLVLACWRGGARLAADRYRDVGLRDVARVVAAIAPAYALTTLVVALLARGPVAAPGLVSAVIGPLLLSGAAAAAGAWRAHAGDPRPPLLPAYLRAAVRGAAAACLVLVAGGALLAALALAVRLPAAATLFRQLGGGVPGALGLLLVQLALLPDLVVWAVAACVGPGFALGAGTSVGPAGVHLAAVPGLPVLAALPRPGMPPLWSWLVLAVPVTAGVAAAVVVRRDLATASGAVAAHRAGEGVVSGPAGPRPRWTSLNVLGDAYLPAALAGPVCGLTVTVTCWLASGAVGALTTAGPSAWRVGVLATLEVSVAAVLTVVAAGHLETAALIERVRAAAGRGGRAVRAAVPGPGRLR